MSTLQDSQEGRGGRDRRCKCGHRDPCAALNWALLAQNQQMKIKTNQNDFECGNGNENHSKNKNENENEVPMSSAPECSMSSLRVVRIFTRWRFKASPKASII